MKVRKFRRRNSARILARALDLYGDMNRTRIGALRDYLGVSHAIENAMRVDKTRPRVFE